MGSCCHTLEETPPEDTISSTVLSPARRWGNWFSFGLLVILAGLVMIVTLAVNLDPPAEPVRSLVHGFLAVLTGASLIIFGWQIFKRVARPKITLESLFIVGLLGAFGASLYSSFTGAGYIYYEVVLVLLAVYRLGQLLSDAQLARSSDISRDIPGLRSHVLKKDGDDWIQVTVTEIKTGDHVKTKVGEVIPVDGVIHEGVAYIEELAHTGEPFPVPRSPGDNVRAGTVTLDGEMVIIAGVDGTDREIDRIARELADKQQSQFEQLAQRILNFFVPVVIAVSIGTFLYWGLWRGNWESAIFNALAVALVACPCGLGLAIPIAARRGRFQLIRMGLRLRDADLIDRLADVDTVIFDKTGTLTDPQISISELQLQPNAPSTLSGYLAAVQRRSAHPVARPFWKLDPVTKIENVEIHPIPARGIEADFSHEGNSHSLLIVNDEWLRERGLDDTGATCCKSDSGSRRLHIFLDGEKSAVAILKEERRPAASSVLADLKTLHYKIGIISGDVAIPQELNIHLDTLSTGATSQDKQTKIQEIEATDSRVLFVGDGLNDAEGAKEAHVSIAMNGASVVTEQVSSASLVHADLTVIPKALVSARDTKKRLHRLLRFVLTYNGIGMTLAAAGFLHPVAAAFLMLASSITVLRSI